MQDIISRVATAHVRSIDQGEKDSAQVVHTLSAVYDRWRAKVNATFWEAQGILQASGTRPSSTASMLRARTNLGDGSEDTLKDVSDTAEAVNDRSTDSMISRATDLLQHSNSTANHAITAGTAGTAGRDSLTAADILSDVTSAVNEDDIGAINSSSSTAAHILRYAAASHDDTITAGTAGIAGTAGTASRGSMTAADILNDVTGALNEDDIGAIDSSSSTAAHILRDAAASHDDTMTAGTARTAGIAGAAATTGTAGEHAMSSEDVLLDVAQDDESAWGTAGTARPAGIAGAAGTAATTGMALEHAMSAEDVLLDVAQDEESSLGTAGTARDNEFVNPAGRAHTSSSNSMTAADIIQDLTSEQAAVGIGDIGDQTLRNSQGVARGHASHAVADRSNLAQDSSIAQHVSGAGNDLILTGELSDGIASAADDLPLGADDLPAAAAAASRSNGALTDRESSQHMMSEDDENVSLGLSHHISQKPSTGMIVCLLTVCLCTQRCILVLFITQTASSSVICYQACMVCCN